MTGIELAGRFYRSVVGPLLAGQPHAAALLGPGSEVLGYDDEVSTDHDFGPRLQLFLPPGTDPDPVRALLDRLPERFDGYPVTFPARAPGADGPPGRPGHRVLVDTAPDYFTARLGVDPAAGMALADWLLTPTQQLAALTRGAVFHDPADELGVRRRALRWYPPDVWRYALAAGWLRVGQAEAFVGRTGGTGDDLGSRLLAGRIARDLVRLSFLVARVWAPYDKWLGRAFRELAVATALDPPLRAALAAADWREREAALCAAASGLAAATNELRLADPVDPAPRRFHDRDIRVLGAERFTTALTGSIVDPQVRALLTRLGGRPDGSVPALPGTIDQAVDSVDVLTHPARCRAAAGLLGLPLV
ncbi:DUF4037 domain-containing protein [Solwaraspora sp. WMMD1047]|uniref:DUF4037 domain-containing protein n=1 Tax=Solwaraspora sp. WMMD1047 TaxID=3016102 RepID=UPI0024164B5E|nr:DUF4037 domain-containing protein [Solwaraspora sp. WMMD1047]MDG4830512.1 DUF4037 domain-containing protein [Solwaraspora sp. WMMD1047]